MRESVFVNKYQSEWEQVKYYLEYHRQGKKSRARMTSPALSDEDYPAHYRRLCNQLALAKTRDFSQSVVEQLNHLVVEGHHYLYKRKGLGIGKVYDFFAYQFPIAVRREKVAMLWALASFVLPALFIFILIQFFPNAAYSFLDESTLSKMEEMYTPDDNDRLGLSRDASSDVLMFGVYIWNNIGIALRSFGSGLIFGIGSMMISIFNGVYLGVIFSHLQNAGFATQTLYPFVITHGAFELTAIVISCGAGLRLGLSLLLPGRYTRGESIARTSQSLIPIVIGFVVMLVIAAFIEAFWSAINMPIVIKYTVGSICWIFVIWYFLQAGRSRESE